ncbi:bone morphogenetic protein 2-like [Biomphalaria glabrata]|uniref:Bone morphogenetic protein 2-like n=2 Tax=Biomphalaria glabrata TaxID=6526 RepID=A0A9W2ZMM9_BIOGL|nr:bone morphogenetic protein 2-like [Biomphalaria glabrata]
MRKRLRTGSKTLVYFNTARKTFLLGLFALLAFQPAMVYSAMGRSLPILPHHQHPSSSLSSSFSSVHHSSASTSDGDEASTRPDAMSRLMKVFGFSRIPKSVTNLVPPQYMSELYATLVDSGGLTRASGPYNSNVIRSFPDKDSIHRMQFLYNISYLDKGETILQAEFRIFKMRPGPSPTSFHDQRISHHILVKVYQILDVRDMTSSKNVVLLDAQKISLHGHGWRVFNVTSAVFAWHYRTKPNYGFLVTAESSSGIPLDSNHIRFAQRNEHHDSKQPILVVYTDNGQRKHPTYISPEDEEYLEIKEDIVNREHKLNGTFRESIRKLNEKTRNANRTRRSTEPEDNGRKKRTFDMFRNRRSCSRYEMLVDFEKIGWSGWIISPNSYNAYQCKGKCPFPLGQSQKPTNHATVQSIVHALSVVKDVDTPCCVPNKLYSISLLYFDDNENVILKQYDDMVVASCGCH